MINTNLPTIAEQTDSADDAKKFFNTFYTQSITLSANTVNAAISFFISRGFSESASSSISAILLSQSKIDNVNVFQLIDTLKGLNEVQLSRVVSEILNYNRIRISTLGTRIDNSNNIEYEIRNIIA